MAIDLTLKSVSITNNLASPVVLNSPGVGGVSDLKTVSGYLASVTAALSITSIVRLCSIPAHAIVKQTRTSSAAQGAGKFDIGVYAASSTTTVGAVISAAFFNAALDCAAAVNGTRDTLTTYTLIKRQLPLWSALAQTEPAKGTMYEICATVVTTDVTTGTGALYIEVDYVM
jgi:hypothetical protein